MLLEDPALELLQLGAGLEPQLLTQRRACCAVDLERVGLTARAVEGQHQLRPEPLPQRVPSDQLLQLRDGCLAELEVGLEPVAPRLQPQLLEPLRLLERDRLVGEVGERMAAPQRERLGEKVAGSFGLTGTQRGAALPFEPLEQQRVDLVRGDLEHVAG